MTWSRACRLVSVSAVAMLPTIGPLNAATITVRAGDNLQSALDGAKPGDTILLEAGATFTGNFTLPVKGGTSFITVRSSAPDSSLPGSGTRITPAFAAFLP